MDECFPIWPELSLLLLFNCLFFCVVKNKYDTKPRLYTFDMAFVLLLASARVWRI